MGRYRRFRAIGADLTVGGIKLGTGSQPGAIGPVLGALGDRGGWFYRSRRPLGG